MTATTLSPEEERDALARLEQLVDATTPDERGDALAGASAAVRGRVAALETSSRAHGDALPTILPGGGAVDAALPPERVGPFRLEAPIGRGGMGEVWLGVRDDGLFEQRVAIKLIGRHALARAAAAFDEERRLLARLEHPHIARLIDGGVADGGQPWLAMELIEGCPIDAACEGLTTEARVALFLKAADAVQYAHSRMIAHADLKPSNILVGPDGRLKLLDFGIARLLDEATGPWAARGAVTRDFASPQRLAGAGPSVADDVFALGRTLALMLGDLPDPELAAILAKAQAPAETARYGSVQALIADAERWRARLPIAAMRPTLRYRSAKFVERHRLGVAATVAALLALGTTSLLATSSYLRAESTRVRAEARFNEVRDLSHFMLFDLYDTLARQPGTVAKRAEIAATSARYLDRLMLAKDSAADLRLDGARSYRRLAAIEGLPGISNLGEPAKAAVALDRAEAILTTLVAEHPRSAAALAELGWVQADRWSLHADNTDSAALNRVARGWFDRALAVAAGDPAARLGRLATERNAGYDLIWSADRPADALPRLREALVELRRTAWPAPLATQARILEINLLGRIGDALYYVDDIPGSLAPYREADALIDTAMTADGATPQWLILKGEAAFNISGSLGDSGHPDEALAVADGGVATLKQLLRYGPDAAAEKKLLVLYGQQAALLGDLGRGAEALTPSGASVALRDARLRRSPGDPQRMRDLAIGLAPHARLLAAAGRDADACAAAARAFAIWNDIRARGRLGTLDARKNLPDSEALRKDLCKD